jgi:hypothetical protein
MLIPGLPADAAPDASMILRRIQTGISGEVDVGTFGGSSKR